MESTAQPLLRYYKIIAQADCEGWVSFPSGILPCCSACLPVDQFNTVG
jgi:hypothetical protein